jgi:CubicO group peptidase (beta-lactamase class C family)
VPGKRSPGSLSWGGINNTFFWIDPTRGIAGVIMMQYLPFADAKALAVYDTFRARHLPAGERRALTAAPDQYITSPPLGDSVAPT